jgi:hypothetical protein
MSEDEIERIRDARASLGGTYLSQKQKDELSAAAVAAGKDPQIAVLLFEAEAHKQFDLDLGVDLCSADCLERIKENLAKAIAAIGNSQAGEEAADTGGACTDRVLRSHSNMPQRVAISMANLKAAAVNLTTAISKKKNTTRSVAMLEKCYQEFKKMMDSLAEEGVISLEDKAARDLESWTVYEDALETNEQHVVHEKLSILNADYKAAEEQLMARVKKINNKRGQRGGGGPCVHIRGQPEEHEHEHERDQAPGHRGLQGQEGGHGHNGHS